MPWWLCLFMLVVTGLLARETILLVGRFRGRVIDLTRHEDRVRRYATGLRLLAWLALAMAIGQREAVRLGWGRDVVDAVTGVLLVVAVVFVVTAWHLARTRGC